MPLLHEDNLVRDTIDTVTSTIKQLKDKYKQYLALDDKTNAMAYLLEIAKQSAMLHEVQRYADEKGITY